MTSTDLPAAVAAAQAFVDSEHRRLDHAMLTHQAMKALYNINRKFDQDSSFEAISEALQAAIKDDNPKTLHQRLMRQAQVLDSAFYWFMNAAATDRYDSGITVSKNAFLAQKQFRQSLQLLSQLMAEKTEKRTGKK